MNETCVPVEDNRDYKEEYRKNGKRKSSFKNNHRIAFTRNWLFKAIEKEE